LATKQWNNQPGFYRALMESGDFGAYLIAPSCQALIVIEED
jgi:hypothetical protein